MSNNKSNRGLCKARRVFDVIGRAMIFSLIVALHAQAQFNEEQKLTASDAAAAAEFGFSVSVSGFRLVVGAFGDSENGRNSGAVYVFQRRGNQGWQEVAKLTASDAARSAIFGHSVSMSGSRVAVGAPGDSERGLSAGAVYIFERRGNRGWLEMAKLTASDADEVDGFGESVAIDHNRLVVGATGDDDRGSRSGSAYVFEYSRRNGWQEVAKLTASDGTAGDNLGQSVSIDGKRLVVGAYEDDDKGPSSGSAYVFERSGGRGWQEVAKLTASDAAADYLFGESVSISGNHLVVGAYQAHDDNGNDVGAAYVFERNHRKGWQEVAKLTASDAAVADDFGWRVSLSGKYLVISADQDDDNGNRSGSAYVFERRGNRGWQEMAKLTASDGSAGDRFGSSVSLSGKRLVIGATEDDDDGSSSGSAYVFDLSSL